VAGRPIAYALDARGRDKKALVELDLTTAKARVLLENPRADEVIGYLHPTTNQPQAAVARYERDEVAYLDPAFQADFERLRAAGGEALPTIVSRSQSDDRWIVSYRSSTAPDRFVLLDRTTHALTDLFSTRPDLADKPLASMQPHVVKARDGLALVTYLSLPPGTAVDAAGRPSQPLPMVLVVHGGPWARDEWGFNSMHQLFASRGYAVLSVNYRGSTGFGSAFVAASHGEWGGKMHDDLLDAVGWYTANGYADRSRVAITGGSYGGYATLVGLTATPEAFACGAAYVGVANLTTFLNTVPEYWKPSLPMWYRRVGDPRTPRGLALLTERSPVTHAGAITKPLFIVHGVNDPRVNKAESDQIVAAMKKSRTPVTYALFPDEGHGFSRPPNRLAWAAATETFLATCLGGRYQPLGDDVRASSMIVPEGADLIPGLAEGLAKR
jgi:dipeptidyl aminopeptidase/acylaminoacyl peptidase